MSQKHNENTRYVYNSHQNGGSSFRAAYKARQEILKPLDGKGQNLYCATFEYDTYRYGTNKKGVSRKWDNGTTQVPFYFGHDDSEGPINMEKLAQSAAGDCERLSKIYSPLNYDKGRVFKVEINHDFEAATNDLEDSGLCEAEGDKLKIIASQRMFGIQKILKLSVGV